MITEQFQPFIAPRRLPAREEIVRQHKSGLTYQQIADRYGTTRQAVGKEMLKYRAEQKKQHAQNAAEPVVAQDADDEAVE